MSIRLAMVLLAIFTLTALQEIDALLHGHDDLKVLTVRTVEISP